jgi:hypothetical protein
MRYRSSKIVCELQQQWSVFDMDYIYVTHSGVAVVTYNNSCTSSAMYAQGALLIAHKQ